MGWKRRDLEEFCKTIVVLAKESLMTPKLMFEFPKVPETYEELNLNNIRGLSLGALSCIVTCLVTRPTSLTRVLLRNSDLTADGALIFELLFASTSINVIEIDISHNPVKDVGLENILKAFKSNKINYLRVTHPQFQPLYRWI